MVGRASCSTAEKGVDHRTGIDNRFPRSARLLDGTAYGSVFKDNVRVSNQHWTLLARYRAGCPARLGLAIAKKRAKRASDRNRLKRIARESFRLRRHQLAGYDVVALNRDAAATAPSIELRRTIDALWSKLQRRAQPVAV